MNDYPSPQSDVLPQVGAILHLDTELPQTGLFEGNKHWKLDGSCALIAADRVLAIRHTLAKTGGRYAVFFPYVGFCELGKRKEKDLELESDYESGDYLQVVRLAKNVGTVAPLPYAYKSRSKIHEGWVSGFGRWSWNESGWDVDGIQRTMKVKFPGTSDRADHLDNLDIGWHSAANAGLLAGNNNSGGPVLINHQGQTTLVGLNRESVQDDAGADIQIASRIGTDRQKWLQTAPHEIPPGARHSTSTSPKSQHSRYLSIDHRGQGKTSTFDIPRDATKVHATLSATPGIRLQMKIERGSSVDLVALGHSDKSSGRFLYRDLPLDEADQITIGIAPVAVAPATAAEVQAQLCVMFT